MSMTSVFESSRSGPPPRRQRRAPSGPLERLAQREQRLFVERAPDQLQSERQTLARKPCRRDESGETGHVDRHRKDVIQIHLNRILRPLLANAKCGEGVAGVRIASTPSEKTRSKSRLMRVRIFCART